MGIDAGTKRVGIALSDPLGMFATGLTTLEYRSTKHLIEQIKVLANTHDVETFVVGLPYKTSGELGDTAGLSQELGQQLAEKTGFSVYFEDERFTSVIAQQALRAQGVQPSKKKGLVDQTSAALILQGYLDKQQR